MPPTQADLYGYSLAQFSAERLSRLLLATTPNICESLERIFPAGTYFGNHPQLPLLLSLVRARFPKDPTPVLDKVWSKDGIDADVAPRMVEYFQAERRKELEVLETQEGGEAREGEGKIGVTRAVDELCSTVEALGVVSVEEASKVSTVLSILQQLVNARAILSPSTPSSSSDGSLDANPDSWSDLSTEVEKGTL